MAVIGMDPAGYDLALGAALLGARVVLATNGESSARFALRDGEVLERLVRWAAGQGDDVITRIAFAARMESVLREIDVARSLERLRAAGVKVIDGSVAFTSPRSLRAGPEELRPRRFLIATGRFAPGERNIAHVLAGWADPAAIERQIAIAGNGSEAIALAGLSRMLGIAVSLYCKDGLLTTEEPEAAELMAIALRRQGIPVHADQPAGPAITASAPHPATEGLALDIGAIATRDGALACDSGLRTSNSRVFGIGSVVARSDRASLGPSQIGPLLGRMLFRKSADFRTLPDVRIISGAPGLAATGLTEREVRAASRPIRVLRFPAPGQPEHPPGLVKAIIGPKGRILGVSIVAGQARELLAPWLLAIGQKLPVEALANTVLVPGSGFAAAREVGLDSARLALSSPRIRTMLRIVRLLG